jgi:AcrR family transcriptional regulator
MTRPSAPAAPRARLSRDRVLQAAVAVADRDGLGALTMRRLGQELGVEAMSLYHHVANKDAVLDGIVDLVVGLIEVPPAGTGWRTAMHRRAVSAHEVLLAHPWAAMLVISRFNAGPGMMRYLDATFGRLRDGGFSVEGALDAMNVLDSHIYGFTLQELNLPFEAEQASEVSAEVLGQLDPAEHPHLVEVVTRIARTGRDEDFELGLGLLLDGLERRLAGT